MIERQAGELKEAEMLFLGGMVPFQNFPRPIRGDLFRHENEVFVVLNETCMCCGYMCPEFEIAP